MFLRRLFSIFAEPELFQQLRVRPVFNSEDIAFKLARDLVEDAFGIPEALKSRITDADNLNNLYESIAGTFSDHAELELLRINIEEITGSLDDNATSRIETIADIAELLRGCGDLSRANKGVKSRC